MSSEAHDHQHGPGCGHPAIRHDDHLDHLHDGELHHHGGAGVERHALAIGDTNPADCTPGHDCAEHDADHEHGPAAATSRSRMATTSTTSWAATCTTRTATTATTHGPVEVVPGS